MDLLPLHPADLIVLMAFWGVVLQQWRRRWAAPLLPVSPPVTGSPAATPAVSVIVPARNEGEHIETCIRSILAQDYPRLEVIAVNDRSDDDTGSILDRLSRADDRLTVIHGAPLPPDWMGKAHAVVQGYRVAKGDWLLFTDADTVHAPWLLSGVMARLLDSPAAFATVWGRQRHPTLGAYLANLAVFTSILLAADQRNFHNPKSRQSLVNGQYVIFTREAYEAIGTHAAVRGYSSTDVSLGYLAKLQGWLPLLLNGRDSLDTTMYRNLPDAFRGWSRSLVNGSWSTFGRGLGSGVLLAVMVGMSWFWITPWLDLWRGLVAWDGVGLAVGGLEALACLTILRLQTGRWPDAARDMLAMPVACLLLVAMGGVGLVSAYWRGGTLWKGRVVQTAQRLPPWQPQPPQPRKPSRGH
jgi:glycosyltransferase involved in cell wall biosynthesis